MSGKIYHVHPHARGFGWVVRGEESLRCLRNFPRKQSAIRWARTIAKATELCIHRWDGTVIRVETL